MKIAYAGYDILIDCLKMLHDNDYEIVKVFTIPSGSSYDLNKEVLEFGRKNEIPVQTEPVSAVDLEKLVAQGCSILICAGYTFKIPVIEEMQQVNIHPSLLPVGRGSWPMPIMILKGFHEGGVTIHKLTEHFDEGDILLQEAFPLDEKETLISITGKIQHHAKDMLTRCMCNFSYYYNHAVPQDEKAAEYWQEPAEEDRTFTLQTPADEIDRKLRAFAGYGCMLKKDSTLLPLDFVQFRPVEVTDCEAVDKIRRRNHMTLSACTFPCIFCWQELQGIRIYIEEDWFAVKCTGNDYYYPCGNRDKTEVFLKQLQHNKKNFRLGYICQEDAAYLKQMHPEMQISEDRNNYDYLVPMKQLAELEGKHFHTIRKEIHQFERSGVLETELLTPENVCEVEKLAIAWSEIVTGEENGADTIAESSAVKYFKELNMQGILVKKDGEYIGFVMGSPLNDQIIDAHFAKCTDKSSGADYYCKQQFCELFSNKYEYMNMEEDMGIEGIRTRKLLMRPTELTPVYLACFGENNESENE